MGMQSIRVTRKFYINGVLQEVGKIVTVSEAEAKGYIGTNKAEIVLEPPPKVEQKKEEPKAETPKIKEAPAEAKKETPKSQK